MVLLKVSYLQASLIEILDAHKEGLHFIIAKVSIFYMYFWTTTHKVKLLDVLMEERCFNTQNKNVVNVVKM